MRADVRQFFVRFNVSSHQIVEGGPGRNVAGAVREYFQSDVDHLLVSAPGGLAVLKSNYLAYTPGEAALLYHSRGRRPPQMGRLTPGGTLQEFGSARMTANPVATGRSAVYANYGSAAKAFVPAAALPRVKVDHGNHFGSASIPSALTELCLVHYHDRSVEQVHP